MLDAQFVEAMKQESGSGKWPSIFYRGYLATAISINHNVWAFASLGLGLVIVKKL
jgi:hypothetical protein